MSALLCLRACVLLLLLLRANCLLVLVHARRARKNGDGPRVYEQALGLCLCEAPGLSMERK